MAWLYESSDGTTSEEEEFATLLEEDIPEPEEIPGDSQGDQEGS